MKKYWIWYWGTDQTDLSNHSEKIRFDDFNEMKNFSAKHSKSCEFLPDYWSTYDTISVEEDDYHISKLKDWHLEYNHIEWTKFRDNYMKCDRCGIYDTVSCICYSR